MLFEHPLRCSYSGWISYGDYTATTFNQDVWWICNDILLIIETYGHTYRRTDTMLDAYWKSSLKSEARSKRGKAIMPWRHRLKQCTYLCTCLKTYLHFVFFCCFFCQSYSLLFSVYSSVGLWLRFPSPHRLIMCYVVILLPLPIRNSEACFQLSSSILFKILSVCDGSLAVRNWPCSPSICARCCPDLYTIECFA